MKIGIIGAGFAGLTAAYDLLKAGHQVTVFEAAPQVGGLASGFTSPGWDWSLERFYHHIFSTDSEIIGLAKAISADHMLFFNEQTTAFFCPEHGAHPVTTLGLLGYPHLPLIDRIRFGVSGLQLKLRNDWQRLERETAEDHLTRWAGKNAYAELWKPLFDGKFGPYAPEINAAWIWARAKSRSFKLGYIKGGFQAFADILAVQVIWHGGTIHRSCPVQRLEPADGAWRVCIDDAVQRFDRVIVTASPGVLLRLVPMLPEAYTEQLRGLKSIGAVVMVAALKQQLLTNGVYWLNITKEALPFLALVEHTNMVAPRHYGGDRLVYCGDYLPTDHRYFSLPAAEVEEEWLASLTTVNPHFERSWVKQTWLFREAYAQPIAPVNHSKSIPPLQTPLKGLFFASLSQVYPWDRGTNFAVELGHRVAREMLSE
jgi:protoporphyrinogen oxidase